MDGVRVGVHSKMGSMSMELYSRYSKPSIYQTNVVYTPHSTTKMNLKPITQCYARLQDHYYCVLCKKKDIEKRYHVSGKTSNVIKHIQKHHVGEYIEVKLKQQVSRKQKRLPFRPILQQENVADSDVENSDDQPMINQPDEAVLDPNPPQIQPTIEELIQRLDDYEPTGRKAEEITRALAFWLCFDGRPDNLVEDGGFRLFVNRLNTRYTVPCRTTIRKRISGDPDAKSEKSKRGIFHDIRDALIRLLKDKFVVLTFDGVTLTSTGKSYLVATASFFVDATRYEFTMGVTRLKDNSTGAYLADEIKRMMAKFEITCEMVEGVTTDGASNVIAAAEILGFAQIWCACHIIHLTVMDTFKLQPDLVALITVVKNVVTWAKQTKTVQTKLETAGCCRLMQSVDNRWNSTLDMLDRFLDVRTTLETILMSGGYDNLPTMPTVFECNEIAQVSSVLKIFKETSDIMSGSNVSVSAIIPAFDTIYVAVRDAQKRVNTDKGKTFIHNLLKIMDKRFLPHRRNLKYVIPTILDPRFKNTTFDAKVIAESVQDIGQKCKLYRSEITMASTSTSSPTTTGKLGTFFKTYTESYGNQFRTGTELSSMTAEYNSYKRSPSIHPEECPINYWTKKPDNILSPVALRALAPQATSVSSERTASRMKRFMGNEKTRMTDEYFHQRIFIMSITNDLMDLLIQRNLYKIPDL